jgi:hypothetical protein
MVVLKTSDKDLVKDLKAKPRVTFMRGLTTVENRQFNSPWRMV